MYWNTTVHVKYKYSYKNNYDNQRICYRYTYIQTYIFFEMISELQDTNIAKELTVSIEIKNNYDKNK